MTDNEFLSLLNEIDFPDRYWSFCGHFPDDPAVNGNSNKKKDFLSAFSEVGVEVVYHAVDRSYECEREVIAGIQWTGMLCKQRCGLELLIVGSSSNCRLGSNFAVLAYHAKQLADPSFKRDPFKGPPPYPRPNHNGDLAALKNIVQEFVLLLRSIKEAVRCKLR